MSVVESSSTERKSPVRKLMRFFERSRDKWKAKFQQLKCKLKGMENQVRAVEKSRKKWADRARQAERRLRELEQQLATSKQVQS